VNRLLISQRERESELVKGEVLWYVGDLDIRFWWIGTESRGKV